MKANELFCKMWDAPYKHGDKYYGSWAVWQENSTLFISFQQTVQKQDWKQNFKIWASHTNFGKLHAGFWQQFEEIAPTAFLEWWRMLSIQPGTIKKVIVCGWSQGGVLASLFYKSIIPSLVSYDKNIEHKCVIYGVPNFIKSKSLEKWESLPCGNVIEFQHSCDTFSYLPGNFTKPESKKVVFGEPFNLVKAVFGVRKYHTSYITCEGADSELIEI